VSASWLTAVLGWGDVVDVQVRPLGSSNGFTCQVVRLAVTAADPAMPHTLIAKFPNADQGRKALFHRLGYAARELSFYRTIAPSSPVRVPALYFGAIDAQSGDSLLLLEDLGAVQCLGSPDSDCGVVDAINAVTAIGRFHAAHWGQVDGLEWIPDARLGAAKTQAALTGPWWLEERVNAQAPDLLHPGAPLFLLAECLGRQFIAVKEAMARAPRTIVHSDFRSDNLFRDENGQMSIIDWENIVRGRGPVDLGAFTQASLSVESRRAHEDQVLRAYVQVIRDGGVGDFGFDECLRDYRLGLINNLLVMVLGVVVLDVMSQRDGWAIEMLRRAEAAAVDHDLVAFLGDGRFADG
jgi:aminoglycoside/choline kinase family phosphotransferase